MRPSARHLRILFAAALLGAVLTGCTPRPDPGTLVLLNGVIYTGEAGFTDAQAMVITGRTITAVCKTDDWAKRYVGKETRVIDLGGRFVVPGLIDAHVDFAAASSAMFDADLAAVADEAGWRREVGRVAARLRAGDWIGGGGWVEAAEAAWKPTRAAIEDLTSERPCLLVRGDEKLALANEAALKAAGLDRGRPAGLEFGPDRLPTGRVAAPSPAYAALLKARPAKSKQRLLEEARAALRVLRESGITEIHDFSGPEQVDRFVDLEAAGDLTCRVWLRPDLAQGPALKAAGLTMGLHPRTKQRSYWLRYGALSGAVDGPLEARAALLFEPYSDASAASGAPDVKPADMEKIYGLVQDGLGAGFAPNLRAEGDRAVADTLALFERIRDERQQPLKGFRLVQPRLVRTEDLKRFRKLGLIAEVNPGALAGQALRAEALLGQDRARTVSPFKSMLGGGALLAFGSEWPGTTAAPYPVKPQILIYAAVTRKGPDGLPDGGWNPEERISIKEALRAYTSSGAVAAFEDDMRGSLEANKLADLTVFDRNLLKIKPDEILKAEVTLTVIDGRVVFEKK